ncbi:MAG TPA: adenylate/guanylate cyclase domain-containing protein [Dehalococcoidia bacterium]
MEREALYCTSADGTWIAYCVFGEGPAILHCPWTFSSFDNEMHEMHDTFEPLWQGRKVVRHDFRGVGLSQRGARSYIADRMVEDIEAVVAAAGLDRFSLYGPVLSSPLAIAYAARHPDQIERLILRTVVSRGVDVMPRENFDALLALVRGNWETASQVLADFGGVRSAEPTLGIRLGQLIRQNAEADDVAAMLTDLYETVDVVDLLPEVECPTLILHDRTDSAWPFAAAQHAAVVIPHARLVSLTAGSVTFNEPAQVQTIIAFLDEDPETRSLSSAPPAAPAPDSAFRTIVFTDLVGHTEMMARLGDERGREVLREHERITREVLAAHGGTEVKTMGDGFMASFGSVTKAVECAIALQRAFAEREGEPLSIRVGLNAGEPIEEEGDLFGATVILASRIAAKAEGGEILVSDNVRSLCSGKGFLFNDRGEFVAKGFEEPVRVYEVSWRT